LPPRAALIPIVEVPRFFQVAEKFTQITINDRHTACGMHANKQAWCAMNVFRPHWKHASLLDGCEFISLTNHGYLCGFHRHQGVKCKLQDRDVPNFEGHIISFATNEDGVCVITDWGHLACYFLSTLTWRVYDTPPELKSVSFRGSKICVLDASGQAHCLWNWDPKVEGQANWDVLTTRLKSIAVQETFLCGTKRNDDIRCFVFGENRGWKEPFGKLQQLEINAHGTVCGTAHDHTIWCRRGLPAAFTPYENE
jgi:hypothetical protein